MVEKKKPGRKKKPEVVYHHVTIDPKSIDYFVDKLKEVIFTEDPDAPDKDTLDAIRKLVVGDRNKKLEEPDTVMTQPDDEEVRSKRKVRIVDPKKRPPPEESQPRSDRINWGDPR